MTNLKEKLFSYRINTAVFIFFSIIYMELLLKLVTCDTFFDIGLLIVPIFSLFPTLILSAICSRVHKKYAKRITATVLCLLLLLFATQIVYHGFFGTYLIFYSVIAGGAGQVFGDGGMLVNTILAILKSVPIIILMALPFVLYLIFGNKTLFYKKMRWKMATITTLAAVSIHIITVVIISLSSLASVQSGEFDPNTSVGTFGLLRTEILDFKYNILGAEQDFSINNEKPLYVTPVTPPTNNDEEIKPIDTSPNIMDIDFETLCNQNDGKTINELNEYFSTKAPTLKNAYTGMYKGYNLISITAEGFSPYAVDPELTPTLYKMTQEGFKFTNFYTPIWGVSTSDGEYTACTGLLPKSGVWSFYRSGKNNMPFCLGNMFKNNGYEKTFAYHNHTHSYYRRDVSHPNMGYKYIGYGTGIEEYVKKRWPESDLEMITGSVKDYLSDDKPFHAYYMTVSGHLQYSFSGNSMSSKNKELVAHLDCSDTLKAYYACNIEFDRAMEKLLEELNKAGVADKTVISITPDHYPYGLERETDTYSVWRELLGHDVDTEFELYKSNFILYCQGTKDAPTIDKYCSSIDILPTLLNLFGFEYDSRLLSGTDILSNSECIIQFLNRAFITSMGKYNATKKEFTLHEGKSFASAEEQEQYVKNVKAIVNNRLKIAAGILETDYYGYLFDK